MNKNKLVIILIAIIAIAGIIVSLTAGFNVNMQTKEHDQIALNVKKDFEISEIKEITKEILKDQEVSGL